MNTKIKIFALALAASTSAFAAGDLIDSADLAGIQAATDIATVKTFLNDGDAASGNTTGGISITQTGSNGVAEVSQTSGAGNTAIVYQTALDNTALISQVLATSSNAIILQTVTGAYGNINQDGATSSTAIIIAK